MSQDKNALRVHKSKMHLSGASLDNSAWLDIFCEINVKKNILKLVSDGGVRGLVLGTFSNFAAEQVPSTKSI